MARKSKKAAKSGANGGDDGAGIGHNSTGDLTDEQRQELALQWKRKLEAAEKAQREATAEVRNVRKKIKAELGDDGVDLIKAMMEIETDAGEARIRARIECHLRAARYMAAPLGSQFDMFEDRTPAIERARAEGKRDAMADKPLANPYDPSVPQHDQYAEGWHEGQKVRTAAQRKRDGELFDQKDRGPAGESAEEQAALAEIDKPGSIGGAAATFQVQ